LLEGCEIDDLDDGHDETKRYKSLSHGPAPKLVDVAGLEQASAEVIAFLQQSRDDSEHLPAVCVVAAGEKTREALAMLVQNAGFTAATITAQPNHADARDVVHFATMHRAKGLEFDSVVVVAPGSFLGDPDVTANQRKLLYVALTRAKRSAVLIRVG
jgi:superfamily I DNA/RNA helicase